MLIARLYILVVPILRMTGALLLLPLHAFIACMTHIISTNCTIPYHMGASVGPCEHGNELLGPTKDGQFMYDVLLSNKDGLISLSWLCQWEGV